MGELTLIRDITRWTASSVVRGLLAGIGDDCAIVRPKGTEDLLITTDLFIEDVHFRRDSCTAVEAGQRAMTRGLSDIAAMGGEARFALASIAVAPWTKRPFLRGFYRGMMALAKQFDVRVIGGDVSASDRFTCDIVVIGAVRRGRAIRRNTAKPGDAIYVSGPLGGAAASNWTLMPRPRLDLSQDLLRLRATACMDLSDGLSLDLHRLSLASGVEAHLESAQIPCAEGASLEQALHGGDDYELVLTLPPGKAVPDGLRLTRIGEIVRGKPGRVTLDGRALKPSGWDPIAAQNCGAGKITPPKMR